MPNLHLTQVCCVVCHGDEVETICGSAQIEAHFEYLQRFHGRRLKPTAPQSALTERAKFTQQYPTDIVACKSCGLIFRSPRPSDSEIAALYAKDRYGQTQLDSLFATQCELYKPKARWLRRWLRSGARILEVGSFVGGFLSNAADEGWDAVGVDPGKEVTEFCRRQGFVVHNGTIGDIDIESHAMDCIAVWNTLDQLTDPDFVVEAARVLLRPGGIFVARVPNGDAFRLIAGCLNARHKVRSAAFSSAVLCAGAWNNLLAFPYLHGYGVGTLDRLMAGHGFRRTAYDCDNLCLLGDDQSRMWARIEERMVKCAIRTLFSAVALVRPASPRYAPWLDIIYEAPVDASAPVIPLAVLAAPATAAA